MCHNHSILDKALVEELIQQQLKLSIQLQNCQQTLATLATERGQGNAAAQIKRWDTITELKTQQITLSSKIELINKLLALGERAVTTSPQRHSTTANS